MGTAVEIRESKAERALSWGTVLSLRQTSLMLMKDRLIEARNPVGMSIPPHRLAELNDLLWAAFMAKDNNEMIRLVKAGADPYSIERRLDSELRRLPS